MKWRRREAPMPPAVWNGLRAAVLDRVASEPRPWSEPVDVRPA